MISRIMWSSTLRIARCCSTNVTVAKTQTFAPLSKIAAANAFNTIMYKGRQKNLISIRELKFLFNSCGPKDAKYAGLGVDWFQEKGFDFSEELNALFIDACLRGQKPEVAVSRLVYRKGRIGAWSTPNSLNKLFEALRDMNDAQSIVNILETLMPKNVRINNATINLSLAACCQAQSPDLYRRVVQLTEGIFDDDYMKKLFERFPIPDEVGEEKVDENVQTVDSDTA